MDNQWTKVYLNSTEATHTGGIVPILSQAMNNGRIQWQISIGKPEQTLPSARPDMRCWSVYTKPATGNKTQTNDLSFLSVKKATGSRCVWWQVGGLVCWQIKPPHSRQLNIWGLFLKENRITRRSPHLPCDRFLLFNAVGHSHEARLKQNS